VYHGGYDIYPMKIMPPFGVLYLYWTLPHLVDTKVSVKYNRRGEEVGKERQRTAGVPEGIQGEEVALAEKGEKPIGRIAADLGINENMPCRRIQQARDSGGTGMPPFPGHGRPQDEELSRLRKEANEILKKAVELQFASSSHKWNPADGVPVHE
jgi:transposase-like protein